MISNEQLIKDFLEPMRPPEHIRNSLDVGYSLEDGNLELYEIRPQWDDTSIIRHHPFAKAKYIKAKNTWKIYWLRASGNWELYKPFPEVISIEEFFKIVKEDKHHAFKG